MSHVRVDGHVLTDAEHMKMLADEEHEVLETMALQEQRKLEAQYDDSGIRRVTDLLEGEWQRRVLTLTPETWGAMTPLEKHQMAQWTERRIKLLSEKLAFQRRNAGADVEVPEWLREKQA